MITNTCLIAGSLLAGAPAADLPDPPLPVFAPGGAFVVAAGLALVGAAAGVGVAAGSTSGAGVEPSAPASELAASEPDAAVEAELTLALVAGIMTFSGERAEASVPPTGELATVPSSTPKPRNTS